MFLREMLINMTMNHLNNNKRFSVMSNTKIIKKSPNIETKRKCTIRRR